MGCAHSAERVSPEALAVAVLMAAQKKGTQMPQREAFIGANMLPEHTPLEILEWLRKPTLIGMTQPPDDGSQEVFQLRVPTGRTSSFLTTLTLPSGSHVAVEVPADHDAGRTLHVALPHSALAIWGAVSVCTYEPEAPSPTRQVPGTSSDGGGLLSPISPAALEMEAPVLLPSDVPSSLHDGEEATCVVCRETLMDGDQPLRQLPCSHTFHAGCVDPWLTTHERSCPSCRQVIGPANLEVQTSCRRRSGAYEEFLAMRESGALQAIFRLQQAERDDQARLDAQEAQRARLAQEAVPFVM